MNEKEELLYKMIIPAAICAIISSYVINFDKTQSGMFNFAFDYPQEAYENFNTTLRKKIAIETHGGLLTKEKINQYYKKFLTSNQITIDESGYIIYNGKGKRIYFDQLEEILRTYKSNKEAKNDR